jgi:hypothetical protein
MSKNHKKKNTLFGKNKKTSNSEHSLIGKAAVLSAVDYEFKSRCSHFCLFFLSIFY